MGICVRWACAGILVVGLFGFLGCGREETAVPPTPVPLSAAELQATIIARPSDSYTTMFIQENLAFLGYGKHLMIVDMSTPSQPTMVSGISFQNQIKQIQATDETVYVTLKSRGTPYVTLESRGRDVAETGLHIIDITDPLYPFELGSYQPDFLTDSLSPNEQDFQRSQLLVVGTVVIDNVAHVVSGGNRWDIVDISNPKEPIKISSFLRGNHVGCMGGSVIIYDLKEVGGYLHLFSGRCRGGGRSATVFDVSDPLNPEKIGSIGVSYGSILDVAYRDNYAYSFASHAGTFLRIFDISDRNGRDIIADLPIPRPGHPLQAGKLIVVDQHVYVASSEGLYVIDVTDRFKPTLVNTLYPSVYFSDIVEANGYIYLLGWHKGLLVLDVSDPTEPVEVGRFSVDAP